MSVECIRVSGCVRNGWRNGYGGGCCDSRRWDGRVGFGGGFIREGYLGLCV